jgi:uncharacterized protein (TIGR00661 family)
LLQQTDLKGKNILICPLDWGLGHTTRCIPIIAALQKLGANIVIAADNRPYELLKKEFPELRFIKFPGSSISYPENRWMLPLRIIIQLPRIFLETIAEHHTLETFIETYHIDIVFSDSRFGLWNKKKPCIYIVHQVMIKCPKWLFFLEPIAYFSHRLIIHRYTECWISDYENKPYLLGDLAHKYQLPRNAHFIGPISRLRIYEDRPILYDLLVILSGPEPQRTIFEQKVISQVNGLPLKTLIVQGKPEVDEEQDISGNATITSYLTTKELGVAFSASRLILSRPGYMTIMDLAKTGKNAILVPTPGQTEQEYLANYFKHNKIFYSESQEDFNLPNAIEQAKAYSNTFSNDHGSESFLKRIEFLLQKTK